MICSREWPQGIALTFEWRGADRRRRYLRRDGDGALNEIWSSAARPAAASGPAASPAALLQRLGPGITVAPLSHGGNSPAPRLLRAQRAGAAPLILKRVVARGDWLARVTGNDGRTGLRRAQGLIGPRGMWSASHSSPRGATGGAP